MDLRLLQSFHAVIEKGSLNAAASELGYAQSTLTQQIQQLEQRLGVQLFHRDGKRLRVSDAGVLLRDRSAALLQRASELDRFFEDVANGVGGRIRLAAVEPFDTNLVTIVRPFLEHGPSLNVTIEVHGTKAVYEALERGLVDFAIAPASNNHPAIAFEPLFFEEVGFLVPRTHRLARKKTFELTDVVAEPLILSGSECEYRRALESAAVTAGVQLRSQLAIGSIEGRKLAAAQGMGIAIVPVSGAKPIPRELILRCSQKQRIGITLGIASRTDAPPPSAAVERLLQAIRKRRGAGR